MCVCDVYAYYLIVCIDGKKYITVNEAQRDTEMSITLHLFTVCFLICNFHGDTVQ
jgi:hypothetical protein